MGNNFTYVLLTIIYLTTHGMIAQDVDLNVELIQDSLKKNANAVIRYDKTIVDLSSSKKLIIKKEYAATAFNERGKNHLSFSKSYKHGSSELKNIEIELLNADGSVKRKIKKKELDDNAAFDGYSLISDIRYKALDISSKDFPLTIKYSYTLESKNTLSIPAWIPVSNYGVSIEHSLYQLIRKDKNVHHKAYHLDGAAQLSPDKFELSNVRAMTKELYAPHFYEIAPHVIFSPEDFQYEGYSGQYANWEEYGSWIFKSLLSKRNNLDQAKVKVELDKIISDPSDRKMVARQLYDYVQENTRYISISLNEGGVQPMLCQDVHDQKYGDCKALTFYLKSLLELYDIPANYVEVFADSDYQKSYDPTFASITQGNHIILNIPLDQDTVWLDCTSHDLPFNFLGAFTDNRKALVINENGGQLVNTPNYDETINRKHYEIESTINEAGEISSQFTYTLGGVPMSNRLHLKNMAAHLKEKYIKEEFLSRFKSLKLISHQYRLDEDKLSSTEEVKISAKHYGEQASKYLLIPVSFKSMMLPRLKKKTKRRYPIEITRAISENSHHIMTLPEGYTLYGEAHAETIKSPYGEYSIQYFINDQGKLDISRHLTLFKGNYEPSAYKSIKRFFDSIIKEEKRQITTQKT